MGLIIEENALPSRTFTGARHMKSIVNTWVIMTTDSGDQALCECGVSDCPTWSVIQFNINQQWGFLTGKGELGRAVTVPLV